MPVLGSQLWDPAPKRASKSLYRTELIDGASRAEACVLWGKIWASAFVFRCGLALAISILFLCCEYPRNVKLRHDPHQPYLPGLTAFITCSYHSLILFWLSISHILGWPQTCYKPEIPWPGTSLLLSLPPRYRDAGLIFTSSLRIGGHWTLGFVHVRQVLYFLSYTSSFANTFLETEAWILVRWACILDYIITSYCTVLYASLRLQGCDCETGVTHLFY